MPQRRARGRKRRPRRRDDFHDDNDDGDDAVADRSRVDLDPAELHPDADIHEIEIADEKLDENTLKIVRRLRRYGHEAYLVGGCVRDLLVGRTPKDFDVATSARPRQVKRLFRNCRIIGRRFKLCHIHFGEEIIEVSTFRRNPADDGEADTETDTGPDAGGEGGDDLLIRRDNVYGSSQEDALRRDFTINALFYDVEAKVVIDYVGGMRDIEGRQLRTIGVPSIRFREDPVRILRCAEFSARLDFTIDDDVADAIEECGPEIERAAKPRVLEELLQALSCGQSEHVFRILLDLNVLDFVVPEIGDTDDIDRLLDHLRELDRVDEGRRDHGDAVLLSVLFLPRTREEEALYADDLDGPPTNPLQPVEAIFGPFAERMGVSRKNAQRVREIWLGLRKLENRSRRRLNPDLFVRRPHFTDTLAVFGVVCRAEARPLDDFERWSRRARSGGGRARAGSRGGR